MGDPMGFLGSVWTSLLTVAPIPLAIGLAFHLVKVGAEARSWHGALRHAAPSGRLPFRATLRAFVAAIGAGAVLPGKLPDVVRVALLRRHPAAPGIAAISGTIALEAVIEVFFGLAVLVSWMALGAGVSGTMAHIPTVPGAFAIGAGAAIGAATIGAGVFLRGRIAGAVHRFLSGFAVVRSPRDLVVGVLGWKVVAWALRFASVWAFLAAFGIPAGRARRRR